MEIKKLVRRRPLAVLLYRGVDDTKPGLGHRFMITARWPLLNLVGSVVSTNAITEFLGGNLETETRCINICELHMCAMMPLIKWEGASFKLFEKFVVAHSMSESPGGALLRAGAVFPAANVDVVFQVPGFVNKALCAFLREGFYENIAAVRRLPAVLDLTSLFRRGSVPGFLKPLQS